MEKEGISQENIAPSSEYTTLSQTAIDSIQDTKYWSAVAVSLPQDAFDLVEDFDLSYFEIPDNGWEISYHQKDFIYLEQQRDSATVGLKIHRYHEAIAYVHVYQQYIMRKC